MIALAAVALAAAVGGGIVGWWIGRRPPAVGTTPAPGARDRDLLPDPGLDWLRRAHGALGVWVAELDPEEEGPRAERLVDAERLTIAQIVAVDRRLERARDRDESGAEPMDGGLFVFGAARGLAAGLLLPDGAGPGAGDDGRARIALAEGDVRRLLDGLQRKPQAVALAQARTREVAFESAASVGLRLAYQLERMLGVHGLRADVVVAVEEITGARIVGASGRADRRLLDTLLPADSALARVARGEGEGTAFAGDPFGGVIVDRRERSGTSYVLPIRAGQRAIGAVLIGLAPGEALTEAVRVEMDEALVDAGPRLSRALEAGPSLQSAASDPLTGLLDRHGFGEALRQRGGQLGALVLIDVDRLAMLNDALGFAAGDAALVHIARLLRGQIRNDDVPARIDGGRFAVWLPDADAALGIRVAERLRGKVDAGMWDWQGQRWPLAASVGVAVRGEGEASLEVLMGQATTALSLAKRNGRNRVETAG